MPLGPSLGRLGGTRVEVRVDRQSQACDVPGLSLTNQLVTLRLLIEILNTDFFATN